MKKLLALLLAALMLLSRPLPRAHADEGEGEAAATSEAEERTGRTHDKPKREKTLEYWEQVELPELKLTGNLREDILIIARSQVDYTADGSCYEENKKGQKRYYTRYGAWKGTPFSEWCDCFVSFCVAYAGNESYPRESSCGRHMFLLKKAGYWREWNSYMPQPGDLVFFNLSSSGVAPTHVGLVEQVIPGEGDKGGKIVTIEGNLPNPNGRMACVRRMTRSLDRVVGYGTYERGKVYPEAYTVRSNGRDIIGEDSIYFIEYPKENVLRFLGLCGSLYYDYWFPKEPEEPETETETGSEIEVSEEGAPASEDPGPIGEE